MILIVVIFFIAIITAFGMLLYRTWEIRTNRIQIENVNIIPPVSEISFRYVEKNAMYLIKHLIQGIVLIVIKYWLIMITKLKKWIGENWPKVDNFFKKKPQSSEGVGISFTQRAILESKSKIKKLRKKIEEEHE